MKLKEVRKEMTDETLLRYVEECVEFLASHGYDATMNDIDCMVSDSTSKFGSMKGKQTDNGNYTVTLSKYLKDEPEETIKNTIYHELCHYLQYKKNYSDGVWKILGNKIVWGPNATEQKVKDSIGHGYVWKKFAEEIGKITNQDIERTDTYETHKEVGKAYDDKIKYIVRCKNCGLEVKFARKTEFVKDPNAKSEFGDLYKWQCGICKSKGQFEVINRR